MDFNEVFTQMLKVVETNIVEGGNVAISHGINSFDHIKEKLERLTLNRIKGIISEDDYNLRLKVIERTIESDMLTLEVITKATAQKTINAAVDVLNSAITKTLSIGI